MGWGPGILVGPGNVTLALAGSLCPAIGDFELCLVTSKLQFLHSDGEIVLKDIPRGGVFGSSTPYTPSCNGGSGACN